MINKETKEDILLIGVNLKIEPIEFEQMLIKHNICFFDVEIKKEKFYYNDLVFYFFKTKNTRQEIVNQFQDPDFKYSIIEYSFYLDDKSMIN